MELVTSSRTVTAFGEAMIEVSRSPDGMAHMGYGGDTLNTVIYLSRLGVRTRYAAEAGHRLASRGAVSLMRTCLH